MKNIDLDISNYLSTYRKTNLYLRNSIYLVLSSLEYQRRITQTKVNQSLVTFFRKETAHKPSKVATNENIVSSVYNLQLASINIFHSM